MSTPKVIVVGAGPGGLTAAMLLARRGCAVTVYEKNNQVGGRNQALRLGDYKFDTGPTFLMLKQVLDEVFEEAGRPVTDYLTFYKLEPMYRLQYDDLTLDISSNWEVMEQTVRKHFPGQEAGLRRYYAAERRRFDKMYSCLQRPYSRLRDYASPQILRAYPYLSIGQSLMDVLCSYFSIEKLALAFTFQAKYLGMSPWVCPGAFAIISFIEHAFGMYHVRGGLSEISEAMARVAQEHGATIHLNTTVKQVLVDHGRAVGVELENGERVTADDVVINADFGYAVTHLFAPGVLKRYTPAAMARKKYSCSIFMLYLGVKRTYPLAHHTIVFAKDYHASVRDVFQGHGISSDVSFYVRNADVTDPTLAPDGHSALYVLVPASNLIGNSIDWEGEKLALRARILQQVMARLDLPDLEQNIVAEHIITPLDWQNNYHVYGGAVFNLAHSLDQMLYLRPHNQFEEVRNCYLVGGGTHPGSGLPTIYESGRIAANLLCRSHGIQFESRNVHS